ncbi:L-histidine N(alpha)-methyltransferase [Pedobacter sp. V48]|uniref:L-histidine N(alpha)-methyltransferase n=1 Tax=Pedobacter sp. V48 TaxID=509635 RepID=UPI0006645C5A|nr:L-histidine N(alpha)-methyltransferase [Pedobacter sp. V48]
MNTTTRTTEKSSPVELQFIADTIAGLKASPKFMHSKYFYDEHGDRLFQQIMDMDEYYLTNAEMDILKNYSGEIARVISAEKTPFDLIELGAGDATKSIHLLRALVARELEFSYLPVDISAHVIGELEDKLPRQLPSLDIKGLNGDYLDMLGKVSSFSGRRKVVLFMGANIGNMHPDQAVKFCAELKQSLSKGDLLIIGFDLKKDPRQILAAYNDAAGITRAFNLNLLERINRELDGDFNLGDFEHYASYDPETGSCKSYLISLTDQLVHIGENETIQFSENEPVFMEISQKYSIEEIESLAAGSAFRCQQHFFDENSYFVDSIWVVE